MMNITRPHLVWLALALALAAWPTEQAQGALEYYDANDSVFESYTTIVFSASDSFIYYVAPPPGNMSYPGSHTNLGTRNFTAPDGAIVPVPVYILNVRMALEAAHSYAKSHGMDISGSYSSSNRFPVYVAPVEGASRRGTGAWATGTKAETVYRSLASWYMTIDPGLSTRDMITIPIHEYFHLVQYVLWSINVHPARMGLTGRNSKAHQVAIEGTAEFFTDQPIPINPIGVNLGASTTDQLNNYYSDRSNFFIHTHMTLFDSSDDRTYESVFFWKCLAERSAGASHPTQMAKIKAFWDGYSDRNVRGQSQFLEEVGSIAGGAGRRLDRFRRFFMEFVSASLVQTGPDGFRDDAFAGKDSIRRPGKIARLDRSHYSGSTLPPIAQGVAANEGEIRQRLNEIATTDLPVSGFTDTTLPPFSFHTLVIGPPDPWGPRDPQTRIPTNPNPVQTKTQTFILVKGDQPRDDAWQVVAYKQIGGNSVYDRGAGIQMQKIANFRLSSDIAIAGRPAAYMRVDGLADTVNYVWLGIANYDVQEQADKFHYAWAVTPTFQEVYEPEGRTTTTVRFDRSNPQRDADVSFHPGDELVLKVNLTDQIHQGRNSRIPANQRSLEVEVLDPSGTSVELQETDLSYIHQVDHLYSYRFKIPQDVSHFGEYTVRWTLRSRLKLGEGDKNVDESFKFELREDRPVVDNVILRTEQEMVYNNRDNLLRPLMPGKARVEIYFDQAMKQDTPAEVKLDGNVLEGQWKGRSWWEAEIEVPSGQEFNSWTGFHRLDIQATAENGAKIDADSEMEGEQPDTDHRFFVGSVPPYVNKITMHAGGKIVYEAEWTGWDGTSHPFDTLHADHYQGSERPLNVKVENNLPTGVVGYLHIYMNVTQPFDTAPKLKVAGKDVPLEKQGHEKSWTGKIELDQVVNESDPQRSIPVEISGQDRYGQQLDGVPGTVTLIDPSTTNTKYWKNYEDKRGGSDTRTGGVDVWHELGSVPNMSLIIVLDASGSMNEKGKLARAKQGINALLNELPPGVELALVTFGGCGNISVHGFTRNIKGLKQVLAGTSAGGGTPLAAAAAKARQLFLTAAHPRSRQWKCRIFSDGQESCQGDVTLNVHELERTIAQRNTPPPEEPRPDEPDEPEVPKIECKPATWTINRVRSRDGGLHLDSIYFEQIKFMERELPNGSCYVRIRTTTHNVMYAGIRGPNDTTPRTDWRIQSNSRDKVESATSRDGRAAIERIRTKAAAINATGKTMAQCRAEIDRIVKENAGR